MPEVTLIFRVAKLGTTAFGEAFSDYVFFNDYSGRNAAILMGLGFLAVCLALQFSTKKYVPWVYWLTVMFTFALGTAAGDYVAGPLNMSTLDATFLFLGVILAPAVAWRYLRLDAVLAFWLAYTITRPLGASFADWLSVPAPYGDGLQLGTGVMSVVGGSVLFVIIAYIVVRHRSTQVSRASQTS